MKENINKKYLYKIILLKIFLINYAIFFKYLQGIQSLAYLSFTLLFVLFFASVSAENGTHKSQEIE